ncbi:hypothetical protein PanWU01x14_102340 [Parasponia andersonii]|uniref:Uncharacterized protein n=1 Tax=Parasponia andersonii TaxID=3476 RepID=A0A2P5D2S2_PARAD|nr:hypothetical protein PanWU01x14_102340 [Parasponia andersonii]
MTGKPPEGTNGSGQPRILRTVGARIVVALQEVAEVVLMEDVLCVASKVTERRSVLLVCRNLLFLTAEEPVRFCFLLEHPGKATRVTGCFADFYFPSALSASVPLSGLHLELLDSSGFRESGWAWI